MVLQEVTAVTTPSRSPQVVPSLLETEDVFISQRSEPTLRGDWMLTVVAARSPKLTGRQWTVNLMGVEIGRQPHGVRAPLAVDDPTLSRSHVLLDPLGPGRGVKLQDCGSRNGAFVNGIRVHVGEVTDRSVLRLGHVVTILTCGQPQSDWHGVRADLPHLADELVPRPDGKRWVDELDVLATEQLLLHRWLGAEEEVKAIFQELLPYPTLSEQAVITLLQARTAARQAPPLWGLRRPEAAELQRLLGVYDGCVSDVAAHLHVHRRQIYRWLDYDRRDRGEPEVEDGRGGDDKDG